MDPDRFIFMDLLDPANLIALLDELPDIDSQQAAQISTAGVVISLLGVVTRRRLPRIIGPLVSLAAYGLLANTSRRGRANERRGYLKPKYGIHDVNEGEG